MATPQDDLNRLLSRQNFKDKKELEAFMQQFNENKIPEIPWEERTDTEKAADLVADAREQHYIEDVMEKLEEAFQYDPYCVQAFVLKSNISQKPEVKLNWLEKALEAGEEKLGNEYEKENAGNYWGLYETRPYMEALFQYAEELYLQGYVDDAIDVAERMLYLNPNDNQGVRDYYSIWLIDVGEELKFFELQKKYPNDYSVFARFNKVLLLLRTNKIKEAKKEMINSMEFNPYVIKWLLSRGQLPEQGAYYNPEKESGALLYCYYTKSLWKSTFGAYMFLKTYEKKAKQLIKLKETEE